MKWLSISSLAEFTSLDRLTAAILSLIKDQIKSEQKNFFWKYLMSASCLTFIWSKFCVLRLSTIYAVLYVAGSVHTVLPVQRGKRKPLGSSATSRGVTPAISVKSGFVLTWISHTVHYSTICPSYKVEQKATNALCSVRPSHIWTLCGFLETMQ